MKDDANDYFIEEEMKNNLESAEKIISYFVLIIDSIFIIFCYFIFKSNNKVINSLQFKLYYLFFFDIIFLLIHLFTYQKLDSIPNDFIFSLLYSCQYLTIISFFEQIIINYSPSNNTEVKSDDPFKKTIIFLFIIISYDKFFTSPPIIIYFIEYGCILGFIVYFYTYLKNIIFEIAQIIQNTNNIFYKNVLNTPCLYPFFSIVIYDLNILKLVVVDQQILILIIIIYNVVNIASKIYIFSVLVIILYIIAKRDNEYNIINTGK